MMRLEDLERRYRERSPLDYNNKEVGRFLARMLSEGHLAHLVQSYSGLPTFLKAPYDPDLSSCDIALIGVPFDLGVVDRPGARFGPRSVRANSELAAGPMHHVSKVIPFDLCRVRDVGDVVFSSCFALDSMIADIEAYYRDIKAAKVVPLSVGGDHSATYPILKALAADKPFGLIHFDAHSDTAGEYAGSTLYNGTPIRNAILEGIIDPAKTVQIGIRGRCEIFWDFAYDAGIRIIHAEDFFDMGVGETVGAIRKIVGDAPVYVTIDMDVLDSAFAPGTGEPEVGGLRPYDMQCLLRGLSGLRIVGGDVMEVSPPYDSSCVTARYAAQLMFELLCVMAESVSRG